MLASAVGVACGSDDSNTFDSGAPDASIDVTTPDAGGPEVSFGFDTGVTDAPPSDAAQVLDVEPSTLQTITVPLGQTSPTVTFNATYGGQAVSAGWVVDRGDLATVGAGPSPSTTVVPTGTTGGLVTVTAGLNNQTVMRQVLIKVTASQNGLNSNNPGETAQTATTTTQLTAGGGVGGVGGEGLGPAVTDAPTLTALGAPSSNGSTQNLAFLYPYGGTVFPRGLLAPLVQWDWSIGDADAIQLSLATTSGSFSWTGTFGRPAILTQTGGKFIRMPVPQDIWDAATNSAGGPTQNNVPDQLTLSLTVAKGAVGYGPISQTYTVAPGRLDGIIYYNSYGTQLAQNLGGAVGGNGKFGGAVLSIHVGDTGPQLVAGSTGGLAQCRVCHSVAAKGGWLVAQHGDNYNTSSAYDLANSNTEHVLTHNATFPGMYPDGSLALTSSGLLLPIPNDTTPVTTSGLGVMGTNLGSPAFSPDGKLVAMNPMSGTSTVTAPGKQLFVMNYDSNTSAFTSPTLVVDDTGKAAGVQPGWPAFFPDGQSLVFHHQSVVGLDGTSGQMYTRKNCQAQIQWTSTANASNVTVLNELNGLDGNGTSYLPSIPGAANMNCTADGNQVGNTDPTHANDINYNYEPTVNPVPSGGYVWVVFTSRRRYGSVATIPPFCSDPRGVNLVTNITPKKLWVAAIDLNAQPGKDASHPAFYLPAQEILAGNSRGFWVLDPCRANGADCTSGDQCCNGYCEQADPDAGVSDGGNGLVCQNKPPNATCSPQGDSCQTTADCCDPNDVCSGGFCVVSGPH
ncbi:MAG TPA: hypothetical protein VGH28_16660 [Polyangiaceae bacterium]